MRRIIRTGQLLAIVLACALCGAARAEVEAPAVELSEHAATRALAASPPMISAPATVQAVTDQSVSIQADASDPDAGDVLTISQSGAPAGLTFSHTPSVSPATATLSGTLSSGDVGSYMINWQVTDGTNTANTTTSLTVNANQDPVVSAPPTTTGAVGVELVLNVGVSDPDGDPIGTIMAAPLPAGATFLPNGFKTSGILDWTPTTAQEGDYTVTFTATSGSPVRTGSATTMIHINPLDQRPVITFSPGGTTNAIPNVLVTFTATATDPDGDAINSFEAEGTQGTALPMGASFTVSPDNRTLVFSWTPTSAQLGNVGVACIATSGALNLQSLVTVKRINVTADRPPVVTAPATVTIAEGALLTVNVTASDPDVQASAINSLTTSPLPLGATFTSNAAHTSGTLSWTPDFTQAGVYNVTFTAMNALTGTATTQITVTNVNRAPIANAGGPYTGFAGAPISFNGLGSSDPDGDVLTYAWDFGDGGTSSGSNPSHAYGLAGSYSVSLHVTDPGALFGDDVTTASIQTSLPANVFFLGGFNYVLPQILGAYIRLEPIGNNFHTTDVLLPSITLSYNGVTVPARCKTISGGDVNHNGQSELRVCFTQKDMKTLFASVGNGTTTVTATMAADLSNGGKIRGDVSIRVVKFSFLGAGQLSSVSPNPLNPQAKLMFVTTAPGEASVQIFDVRGRVVRNLMQRQYLTPGVHELIIDGRNEQGNRLSSGTYFYRIQSGEGPIKGSFQVLK